MTGFWQQWLRSWWRRATPRRLSHWHIVLYTRTGCHLCDAAWHLLQEAQRCHRFALEMVDIDADPALVAEHGLHVPVVSVNGKVRFRGVVNEVLLQRMIDAGR